jgi:hypothetical protein
VVAFAFQKESPMPDPKITRIELITFEHTVHDLGSDYNGFNQVYEKGAVRTQRRIEGDLTGGWLDFTFSKSTLLFTKDDSVSQWYKNINHIGTRDQAFQLMRNASSLQAYKAASANPVEALRHE